MKAIPTARPIATGLRRLAAVSAFAVLAAAGMPVAAQDGGPPPPEFQIDESGWQGGAVARPETGQFSHCAISRRSDDGLGVVFQASPNFELNIGIASDAFELEPGREFTARVTVDDRYDRQFPAVNAAPTVVLVATSRDPELVESLMRGREARVEVPDLGSFPISLSGTFNAFGALEDCVQKARELIAEAQGQAGAQPDGAATAEAAPGDGEARAPAVPAGRSPNAPPNGMTSRALLQLLRDAGFEEVALADPRSIPEDDLALSHVWQIDDGLIGGLHQEPRGEEQEMAGFVEDYTGLLAERCPGEASVETGEVTTVRDLYAFADATVDCQAADVGSAHVALFFALDDNHYSAFFHETSVGRAEDADAMTAMIADFVRAVADTVPEGAAVDAPADPEAAPAEAQADAETSTPTAEGGTVEDETSQVSGEDGTADPAAPADGETAPAQQ